MLNIVNVGYDSTNYYVIETATTKGMAFTGDLPPPHMATDETLQRSWAAIQARKVHTIYPGHGPVYHLADEHHGERA
ncbi:MAG: hypothetical protein HGA45_24910 [Chloroflexales bacterium]|nr:hypothetical protein [Chloroflexales bacterium]